MRLKNTCRKARYLRITSTAGTNLSVNLWKKEARFSEIALDHRSLGYRVTERSIGSDPAAYALTAWVDQGIKLSPLHLGNEDVRLE
jgi:hypothetical protein